MDYVVFDSLYDGVVVINDRREIIYCNEAAAALAGSSVRRMSKNTPFDKVFSFEENALFPSTGGEMGRENPLPLTEMRYKALTTGQEGRLQVSIQPFQDGSQSAWVILLHDVTLEETLHTKYQGELEARESFIKQLQEAKAQLENYSKNLEQMVQERTQELAKANLLLRAVMDSLGQGFVVFGRDGICTQIYTKACEDILECVPGGRHISDVLSLDESGRTEMNMWIDSVFDELLPFDSLVDLAPSVYKHSQDRLIGLNYYLVKNEEDSINGVVLVATDQTVERDARIAIEKERAHVQLILKAIKSRDHFLQFSRSLMSEVMSLKSQFESKLVDKGELYRWLHTLEGEAATLGALPIRNSSRAFQENLSESEEFSNEWCDLLVVCTQFLDENRQLLDLIGFDREGQVEVSEAAVRSVKEYFDHDKWELAKSTFCDQIYKRPIQDYLLHLDEVASVVAESLSKQIYPIAYNTEGVRVSPNAHLGVFNSLVHAIRNAVDHGIETPEERISEGKDAKGIITITSEVFEGPSHGDWVRLTLEDDGRGIDAQVIRGKLNEKFPGEEFDHLTDDEVIQQVFRPGFSSRSEVGNFSGRGVGMDAIKSEVEKVGGRVWIESRIKLGSRVVVEFPSDFGHNRQIKAA